MFGDGDNWIQCEECGGSGEGEHDCFEDTCCCLDPEPGPCEECGGFGGWEQEETVEEPRYLLLEAAGQQRLPIAEQESPDGK